MINGTVSFRLVGMLIGCLSNGARNGNAMKQYVCSFLECAENKHCFTV